MASLDETDSNVEFVTLNTCSWDGASGGSGGSGPCAADGASEDASDDASDGTAGTADPGAQGLQYANLSWLVLGHAVATATTCEAHTAPLASEVSLLHF